MYVPWITIHNTRKWNQPKAHQQREGSKKNHLVMGKNKIITSAANWMELGIISSKRSQTQEGKTVASFLSNVKSRMASADEGAYTNRAQK